MRVRLIETARPSWAYCWSVQVYSWWRGWRTVDVFYSDISTEVPLQKAMKAAKILKRPEIKEIV